MSDSKIERGVFHPSFRLTADTNAGYLAVALDTTKEGYVKVAGATDKVIGILTERGPKKADDGVGVRTEGNVVATYGGTITVGTVLSAGANGQLVAQTAGGTGGVAIALENGVAGETHQVKLAFSPALPSG